MEGGRLDKPSDERSTETREKHVRIRFVDLGTLGQLAVGFETPSLVGAILEYDVAFLVLVVAQAEQDDVALVDPDLFPQFAPNVRQSLFAVEAQRFQPAVA